ncbi:MAG: tRNA-(ms[2]io[6]A)-hydroxylase [Pseudomonadota bacterium]
MKNETQANIGLPLRAHTPTDWTQAVMADFDSFLLDHAAAEKKASGMAMSMLSHYPDKVELVAAMADLAVEELSHYREVVKWIHKRGLVTAADTKDHYVLALRDHIRDGRDVYLLDRLLIAGVIEARGAERVALIAEALPGSALKRFYQSIARSEQRHFTLFLDLARLYIDETTISRRWDELLDTEAAIMVRLPIKAALH